MLEERIAGELGKLLRLPAMKGGELSVLFVDEGFGVVELLLRPPPAEGRTLDDLRENVRIRLEKAVPDIRDLRIVAQDDSGGGDPAPVPANARAGLELALDMLKTLQAAAWEDGLHGRLRDLVKAKRFLSGPCRDWIAEAGQRIRELPGSADSGALLTALQEIFIRLSRAARQVARLVEAERAAWPELAARRAGNDDGKAPELLNSADREEYRVLLQVLDKLRPPLGRRDLEGFLWVANPSGEEEGEYSRDIGARVVMAVLKDAVSKNVIDVYIEPGPTHSALFYKKGRRLEPAVEFPRHIYPIILAKFKKLARLDVGIRGKAQEGSFRLSDGLEGLPPGLRVDVFTAPSKSAERMRLRLRPA